MKYYILKNIDTQNDLDEKGLDTNEPCKYISMDLVLKAKDKIGNCYIDMKREEE